MPYRTIQGTFMILGNILILYYRDEINQNG